ncbi:MAG: hypothetical protein LKI53_01160 [Bacteroidales bacterium]|jgi:hypothetical protein|nr:hypothetical protein [Bacteroidales bacterium]
MRNSLTNIIRVVLAVLFLTPANLKIADGLFHHHDHFTCHADKNEHHFHEFHEKCYIAILAISSFIDNTPKIKFASKNCEDHFIIPEIIAPARSAENYYLLRAPPFLKIA